MTDPITLVQFPRRLGVPNPSPFCVKLELWLKLAGIDYVVQEQVMPGSSPKKKIPYVIIDGQEMGDSTLIIEHLTRTRGVDPDNGLSDRERALDQAIWAMCDERLYWYAVWDRWLGAGWPVVAETFFGGIPAPIRPVVKFFAQRSVRQQLWAQGTGRHSSDEILGLARRDVDALASIVGDGPYVHGDKIRSIDAVVYAFVVNMTEVELDTPVTEAARAHANLVAYALRITEEYFPDLN